MDAIETITFLFGLLDDIDTADDICKSNDEAYRKMVQNIAQRRWKTEITSDGYSLDLSKIGNKDVRKDCEKYPRLDEIRQEEPRGKSP